MQYEIRVDGVLDEHWSAWFDGLHITSEPGGVSLIADRSPIKRRCTGS